MLYCCTFCHFSVAKLRLFYDICKNLGKKNPFCTVFCRFRRVFALFRVFLLKKSSYINAQAAHTICFWRFHRFRTIDISVCRSFFIVRLQHTERGIYVIIPHRTNETRISCVFLSPAVHIIDRCKCLYKILKFLKFRKSIFRFPQFL